MKVKVPIHRTSQTQSVLIDPAATIGAQIGVNLLLPDGSLAKMSDFGATSSAGGDSIDTTDALDEGAYHFYFTDRRAQDAVGGILADTATIDLAYTAGTSITATLKDLPDSGTGAALVKITRDAKGRISGTSAATTTDLTEGSRLYYTDARADARITLQKAQPLGLATLDAGGKLDAGQLPALAITETFVVNTQAAMLALAAQEGDVAVRTDLSQSFILTAAPASTLANWQELLTPASPVTSIFGRVGSVTAATGDYTFAQIGSTPTTLAGYGIADAEPTITAGTTAQYWRGDKSWQTLNKAAVGLANVDNTSDANKPVSTAQAAAIASKADGALLGYGTYTPTLTAVANISASSAVPLQWLRVGDTVTLSGRISVTASVASNTFTRIGLSIPVASNFNSGNNAGGAGAVGYSPFQPCLIVGDATNERIELQFYALDTVNRAAFFTATYLVLP